MDGEPEPSDPGLVDSITLSVTTGTRLYFAIRALGDGGKSDLSNVPSFIDIGFRPNEDGYSFENYGGTNLNDFTADDMLHMFGVNAVCRMVGSKCIMKPTAEIWYYLALLGMSAGHCEGMAVTSLRFYEEIDNPYGDTDIVALNENDNIEAARKDEDGKIDKYDTTVRRHIAYYHVPQYSASLGQEQDRIYKQNTPKTILGLLYAAMSNNPTDPTVLFMKQSTGGIGHAVSPIAITDDGNRVCTVHFYDNVVPQVIKTLTITETNDAWHYPETNYSGDKDTHNLGVTPISKYAEPLSGFWGNSSISRASNAAQFGQVWLTGDGHLRIINALGQRIGYVDDQFVNEISGAYETVNKGGLGIRFEPLYTLPLSDTYTITVDGQTLTQTGTVAITQFGPNYAVQAGDVTLGKDSQDILRISPDGRQISYQASGDQEPTLTLALDSLSESYQLQVKGADIASGETVTLAVDIQVGRLEFNNAHANSGEYDLEIQRVSQDGRQTFLHAGLVISATDTHYANFGDWDGTGPVTLQIDHDSDGTIDETLILDNESRRTIFLPLVLRNYASGTVPTNYPPNTPSSPTPSDGATNQSVDVTLSWTGDDPDGDSVTYDVYFEADADPPTTLVSNDQSGMVYAPGTLSPNTHYYWQVVARDAHDATTTGPVWDFSTGTTTTCPINLTLLSPQITDLTATVNGVVTSTCSTITRLNWQWGDGTGGDQWFPASHTYAVSGTYPITVTAYNDLGDAKMAYTTASVNIVTGDLDPAFGSGGKVTTPIGSGDDCGQALAIQADGKIVVAGISHNGTDSDFAVVRYNTDGSLDTAFGSGGKVTTDFGYNDMGEDVALQSDGKIVVVGYSEGHTIGTPYYGVWAIVRYNTDGSLDTTFDGDGKVTTDIGASIDSAFTVAIQSDGKIVVGGQEDESSRRLCCGTL